MPRLLKLLVLTEDTGKHGWLTAKEIVRKLLQEVDPAACLWQDESENHSWIDPRNQQAFDAMKASSWKGHKSRATCESERALRRAIATHLLMTEKTDNEPYPVGFVFFHHDGDSPWSLHPDCTICGQFRDFKARLEEMLRALVTREGGCEEEKEQRIVSALGRLFVMQPHWTIESWLVGKSKKARELCTQHHQGAHNDKQAHWNLSRCELEECECKDSCCLHDAHNLELAQAFKADQAFAESPSFSALVCNVLDCQELTDALATTHRKAS